MVAGKELGGEGSLPVLGHEKFEGAHPGFELPRFVAVALAFAAFGAFVGSGAYVFGDLGFQELLKRPLDDVAQEFWIVQQYLLHQLLVRPTMGVGHRDASLRSVDLDTNHLGGRWPSFL
jgi:hypothetical protein